MRSARMGQAVILMMVVAVAASCAATKEYTSKLFPTKETNVKTNQTAALKFLDLDDSTEKENENWVSTDIISGRDTISKTLALDNFIKTYPASGTKSITTDSTKKSISTGKEVLVNKPAKTESESEPVARYMNQGEIRTKRTRE